MLIGIIIIAALLALVQINAQRNGTESPISTAVTTVAATFETATSAAIGAVRNTGTTVVTLPQLQRENAELRAENSALVQENARLHELAAQYAGESGVAPLTLNYPHGIDARVVGFPPENESRTVTIDRGSNAGVRVDEGVIADGGVVGRVVAVTPFASQVALITDYTSRLPAVTRRGRYWGIARGNVTSVRVEYIPQDASLHVGEIVVTGEGRSFDSGIPVGSIVAIERSDSALSQTAIVKPAVNLGSLDRVVVITK